MMFEKWIHVVQSRLPRPSKTACRDALSHEGEESTFLPIELPRRPLPSSALQRRNAAPKIRSDLPSPRGEE